MAVDQAKLDAFMGKLVGEMGAVASSILVMIGDKLGLYKALAAAGPSTSAELAAKTGTAERYVREWLAGQAAAGYVDHDAVTGRYAMNPEQVLAFADEGSPVFVPGFHDILGSLVRDEPKFVEAFRTGKGVGWHEHDAALFHGTERFFRPGYSAHLVNEWIPALDGVEAKLARGGTVADVGCGYGTSTLLMAKAFPNSRFVGFDYHAPSVERARAAAKAAGLDGRVGFEVAAAKDFPGRAYDLVTIFDALHDMGDPVGAAKHVRETLAPDGTWMIVEPMAGDTVAENLNPVGRIFYAASTVVCTPASLSQEVGLGLGAQAGEKRLREVITAGGFTRIRRATETPVNMVLEARP